MEWIEQCAHPNLTERLEADGAVCYSSAPFNEPKEGEADSSAYSRFLLITLRGRPGHGWLLLLERYGSAAAPASPWTDFDRELLEDSASVLGMALENNLLSAQSAERASYLTNMLNSLDVAVMVIEQPPAAVPAVVSLVNRSFCELFGLERAQVETNSYLHFMDLARPLLPDWDTQLTIIEDLLADPTAERIDEITLVRSADPDAVPTHLHRFATHCALTPSGLFPWGEHAFWNLSEERVGNGFALKRSGETLLHDHLSQALLWLWEQKWGRAE